MAKIPSKITVHVWQEDDAFVAQCVEINVASQGDTEEEALANVREALELYCRDPLPTEIEPADPDFLVPGALVHTLDLPCVP